MELLEIIRRLKRGLDGYISYRKAFFIIVIVLGLIYYLGPSIFGNWRKQQPDILDRCLSEKLQQYTRAANVFDASVRHVPREEGELPYIPYIGNGLLGLSIDFDSPLYIKSGRTLSRDTGFFPIVASITDLDGIKEATVVNYIDATAHRIKCVGREALVTIEHKYYAHRTHPAVFVQEIKVTNPSSKKHTVQLMYAGKRGWASADMSFEADYVVVVGYVDLNQHNDLVVPLAVVMSKISDSIEIAAQTSQTLTVVTAINYTEPVPRDKYPQYVDIVRENAIQELHLALKYDTEQLRNSHVVAWYYLWSTGFSISTSKAADAINGNQINATIYYVASQVRAPLFEVDIPKQKSAEIAALLTYSEGCYAGHHTLQATSLWSAWKTINDVITVSSYWLMTLEKQGCHNLLRAGASGVVQGMVLSFGALKFSNQHLEFNTDPKDLHRDYHFRRVWYGNATHVNISVTVQEDNKAVLYVALDRSDKSYYACDAGCVDTPVLLGPHREQFPVKLTNPVTAVLYITSDRLHMEELRHTIHVKEIAEAPAHENNLIALHRHGHSLGGLPTLFWVSIFILIVIFHLFLFKLIYREYYSNQDKYNRASFRK